jgi:phage terminase large subunit-like protein
MVARHGRKRMGHDELEASGWGAQRAGVLQTRNIGGRRSGATRAGCTWMGRAASNPGRHGVLRR